ncbi:hypothetical protein CONPUDRAFT_156629 [Coniophora puteana RWD-64-598 SS2]|uniref:Uncharacterized protein n=1 Tax=Coniophora puteana (strain RWD-64-598) TaxID=741705 RepID=A0A5M3MHT4_CONPW|nr:uncharacterized protein CONPUDRAFT_156629 [Coniophora puteana RWD-64-598 SS2]EIW78663.1 hypothetical protein CONPUDRAFT_156629 [Coniophora puteana RWD-64-598 SS2]
MSSQASIEAALGPEIVFLVVVAEFWILSRVELGLRALLSSGHEGVSVRFMMDVFSSRLTLSTEHRELRDGPSDSSPQTLPARSRACSSATHPLARNEVEGQVDNLLHYVGEGRDVRNLQSQCN